jgi:predicted glycosyltransferase involved in capsule biosynthesis
MEAVTIVIVYQDSMPWLELCVEALKTFKNEADIRYIFVENHPHNDQGFKAVDDFISITPNCEKIVTEAPPCTDGRAHEHGLNLAYEKVTTEWTLFMDADAIVLRDHWLDDMWAST